VKYQLAYSQHAVDDLAQFDKKIADRFTKKVAWFVAQENPLTFAKTLKPPFENLYRFRLGDYRAIFELNSKNEIHLLIILRVKHRKEVYG